MAAPRLRMVTGALPEKTWANIVNTSSSVRISPSFTARVLWSLHLLVTAIQSLIPRCKSASLWSCQGMSGLKETTSMYVQVWACARFFASSVSVSKIWLSTPHSDGVGLVTWGPQTSKSKTVSSLPNMCFQIPVSQICLGWSASAELKATFKAASKLKAVVEASSGDESRLSDTTVSRVRCLSWSSSATVVGLTPEASSATAGSSPPNRSVTSGPSRLSEPVSKLSWRLCKSSVKLTKWPNPCVAWPSVPTVSEERPLAVQSMELTAHQSPPLKDENFRHKKGQTLPPNPWWTMLRAKHKIHPIWNFTCGKRNTSAHEQNKSLTNCFFEKLANSDLKTVLLKHGCVCK